MLKLLELPESRFAGDYISFATAFHLQPPHNWINGMFMLYC